MISDAYVPTGPIQLATSEPPPLKRSDLERHLERFFEINTQLSEPSRRVGRNWLNHWLRHIGNRPYNTETVLNAWVAFAAEGYAERSLENARVWFRRFEKYLRNTGLTSCSATMEIRTIKPKPKMRQAISDEEYLAISRAAKDTYKGEIPISYVVDGLWMTGMAVADLCMLQWTHWNPQTGTIHGQRKKTGTDFIIPLLPDHPFRVHLERRFPDRLKTVGEWPSVGGKHYIDNRLAVSCMKGWPHQLQYALDVVVASLGMRRILLHDFRATFISRSLQHSDPAIISVITGHSNPSTLMKYAKPRSEALRRVMERNQNDPGLF